MPTTPDDRLGLVVPTGGDPANVPSDLNVIRQRLRLIMPGYAQGTIAARASLTPFVGLLYLATDGAADGGPLLTYYDGASWVDCSPQELDTSNSDLTGDLPRPTVHRIQTAHLKLHTVDGRRQLHRELRTMPSTTANAVMVGTLTHSGAVVDVAVSVEWSGGQRMHRYTLAVVPTADTGWRLVRPTSVAGPAADTPILEAREQAGALSLRLRGYAASGATAEVILDIAGRPGPWTPDSTAAAAAAVTAPFSAGGPTTEISTSSTPPTNPYPGMVWRINSGTSPRVWRFIYNGTNWVYDSGGAVMAAASGINVAAGATVTTCPINVVVSGVYRVQGHVNTDQANADGRVRLISPSSDWLYDAASDSRGQWRSGRPFDVGLSAGIRSLQIYNPASVNCHVWDVAWTIEPVYV
ncbi:hypothetical protein PAI11_37670 [Patulibacter medicamentivorans]|uniref:Uncharacterized protein n=1 Tax=Patulibacter medicamentivorans TaxID=1097667 RepID=H0EA93_9ACTN|nr:hypothetical protein [Patulibacter medicamentivorans]EHN09433.1 hypothetical protein PAI11_37670 [Patulibacter medicamentivorans]